MGKDGDIRYQRLHNIINEMLFRTYDAYVMD